MLFRAADVIGLALSGGGIRSATFNLGLLQGLHRLNLLALVDYLSTVSGGGYVGSFWSEWIARRQAALQQTAPGVATPQVPPALLFPSHRDAGSGPQDGVDRPQERHLREFSGFLAPRWGFFEVETWTALVALISGLLPAVAIALSIIGVLLIGWLSLTSPLAYRSRVAALPIVMGITALVLAAFERMWHRVKPASAGHTGITDVRATQADPVWAGHLALPLRVARLHRARRLAAGPAAGSLRARHAVPAAGVRGRVARGAGAERLRAVVDRHRHRVGRQALAVQPAAPGLLGGLAGGLADHGARRAFSIRSGRTLRLGNRSPPTTASSCACSASPSSGAVSRCSGTAR